MLIRTVGIVILVVPTTQMLTVTVINKLFI